MINAIYELVNSAETRENARVQYFDEEEINQAMVFGWGHGQSHYTEKYHGKISVSVQELLDISR